MFNSKLLVYQGVGSMFIMCIIFTFKNHIHAIKLMTVYAYHLVIQPSHGESPINGGFNGKILYKWVIFHGYVK